MSAANLEMLKEWFDKGKLEGQDHMIIICDTFSHEDYPVFTKGTEEFWEEYEKRDGENMQRIMEVYNLNGDKEAQFSSSARVFNFPEGERGHKKHA